MYSGYLVVIGIRTATPMVEESNIKDLETELMLIQAKWKVEIERVNFDGTSSLDADLLITEGENKGKLKEEYQYWTEGEPWIEEGVKYYQLPDKALESMGVHLEKNQGYIVNYKNDEIIYRNGLETEDGNVYYKLSEIKQL